ncbi:MAG TPA: glycosyl hydrolase [Lachnospiraceae bacterium]|nr:glycosyl hydrolase [Lachnospiraceae bacterium]
MKHKDLIEQLTLEEKAALLGGKGEWDSRDIPRLGIPSMIMSDGPHGLRRQAGAGDHLGLNASLPATCFPTAATMANSWDRDLGTEVGEALGEEALAMGVNILLGPGMNIKRSPLCGRNFEYFSEDPYLAGRMAASYVKGIQSKGVYSCIKHFAVNSQEERRMAMNAVVDERTLREIYLTGFEVAIDESKPGAVMTSYNQVNGEYANESMHLLKDILRGDWGYDGFVVSDWGGANDHVTAVKAGSDLEMPAPGLGSARELVEAVKNGSLSMEDLDARVDELLDAVLTTTEAAKGHSEEFDVEGHHALARKAAAQCAILLKNDNAILPLKEGTKVAVVGDFAFLPRYQGAGSSMVNSTKVETIENLIREEKGLEVTAMCRGYKRNGDRDEALLSEAVKAAEGAEVVLYFFGLDEMSESEGLDRHHMRIPKVQIDVLRAMAKVNPNIVGVISAGSSIEMEWEDSLSAILHGYLTGQAGAGAMLDLITGRVNPSGKLAETYPLVYEDVPSSPYYPAKERNSDYREALFVGYRYFDTFDKAVRYPFGFGLSYTTFEYSGLTVDEKGATFTVKNTGSCDGAEVAQLYVSLPGSSILRARKELKGFVKVFLAAGEAQKVTIPFDGFTFRYWNVKKNGWAVEGGEYTVSIGSSVRDICLTGTVTVAGDAAPAPYDNTKLAAYRAGKILEIPDEAFSELLGGPIPDGSWSSDLNENDAICQLVNARSGLARFVYKQLEKKKQAADAAGKPDLNVLFIYNMPFRAIGKMTGGAVDKKMVDGMVDVVNGHFFSGLGKVIGGYFSNMSANKKYEEKLKGEK